MQKSEETTKIELPFMTKVKQSMFVTKRKLMESLGDEPANIDPELQLVIDKLQMTASEYTNLYKLANKMYYDFKAFAETQKLLGSHLYEIGVKEEEGIRESLQEIGTVHRNLEKDSIVLLKSLGGLIESIKTFRNAAVQDTLINLERYTETRQEYEGIIMLINDLEQQTEPPQDEIAQAKQLAEETKILVNKYAEDLKTKVSILDEKRIQVVKTQLKTYIETLCSYYLGCNEQLSELEVLTSTENTSDFNHLVSTEFKLK